MVIGHHTMRIEWCLFFGGVRAKETAYNIKGRRFSPPAVDPIEIDDNNRAASTGSSPVVF